MALIFTIERVKQVVAFRYKVLVLILVLLNIGMTLNALSFTSRLTGVTTHPDFWAGVFPSSVRCYIGLDGIQFLDERKTEVGAEIATGTLARTITQNPLTGRALTEDDALIIENSSYDVLYASWKAGIAQGIGWSEQANNDLVTLRFSLDGQWEVAMDPLMQSENRTGYPFSLLDVFNVETNNGQILQGTPDLSNNRQLLSLSFDLYGKVNQLLLKTGRMSGISTEFKFVWAPSFLNLSKTKGGVASFWKIWFFAKGGFNIHQAVDENGMNLWSIGLSDEFEMRIFGGDYIPEYAKTLKSKVWWVEPENMTFMARNILKLDYYGQQFFGSCIPYVYAFLDICYSGGKVNNVSDKAEVDSVWAISGGVHIELQLFGAAHIYYEIGQIFLYTGNNKAYEPGYRASSTIKISISLAGGSDIDWSI